MRWASRNRFAPVASVLVAVLTAALWIGLHAGGAMTVLELDTVDARFPARPDRPANEVAVVAVDDVTFNELRAQWPFRRSLHARVIDRLRKAGAKVIAVDVQFTEPTKLAEDNALIDAVDRAPRIVLATTEVDKKGRSNVLGGEELLNEIGARSANAILNQDQGGVQRRIPYSFDGLESFAVAASELATGRQVEAQLVRRRGRVDRLPRAARHDPDVLVLARAATAASRPTRSRAAWWSWAPPRRGCRTSTPSRPAATS